MSCIGTAGHVDHGKSTLVKALTGIDPDRLTEEKERGMTIDLGFAWLTLPSGREVSIVDVPGHESFIKNMLAGVGGIDAALLVVAADEGVMPQTREHLAILDLLRVPRGVVALTKADLVDDEWLELVREEVETLLKPTTLAHATILPVSAYSGLGLKELVQHLDRLLQEAEERQNIGRPRLPVDRVFTMTGFGTIVTGTLLDGTFKVGQEVELLPGGIRTRIRNLQTHRQQIELAQPGSRVAINLANVARSDIKRGDVVTLPGQLHPTMLFDARIQLLADAPHPLQHNTQVDMYSGAQEISARVRLLDREELQPGQSAWAQLRLSQPAVVARRDRFILRIPSPSLTIGGGEVIDVQPRYHRRHQVAVLENLERLAQGTPEELILAALDRRGGPKTSTRFQGYTIAEIAKQCNLAIDVTQHTLTTLLLEGRVRQIGAGGGEESKDNKGHEGVWFAQSVWEQIVAETTRMLSDYHRQYPLRGGLSKEEWRTRLGLSAKMATLIFSALQAEGYVESVTGSNAPFLYVTAVQSAGGSLIRLPDFTPRFTGEQQKQVELLLQRFAENPFSPPGRAEAEAMTDGEIVAALIEQGRLVKLNEQILLLRETCAEAITKLVHYLRIHRTMTAAEARDELGATRKTVLPLLEYMDTLRITRRVGDERVLGIAAEKIE
jgi:selenocysteine-specific elongation factor